jgi:hypothetical protein
MLQSRIAAVLLGGLSLAPLSGAMAQEIATAPVEFPRNYVVFMDSGTHRLSDAALDTVRSASISASSGITVRLIGRPDYAQAVKQQMVKDGVPEASIVVIPENRHPLPAAGDGLADTANRKVEIKL